MFHVFDYLSMNGLCPFSQLFTAAHFIFISPVRTIRGKLNVPLEIQFYHFCEFCLFG